MKVENTPGIAKVRAFTLVETLVTLGVFAVLTTLVTQLTMSCLQVTDAIRFRTEVHQASVRVHERLRRDLYGATRVAVESESLTIDREDGRRVRYRWSDREEKLYRLEESVAEGETSKPLEPSMTPPRVHVTECRFTPVHEGDPPGGEYNLLCVRLRYSCPRGRKAAPIAFTTEVLLRACLRQ